MNRFIASAIVALCAWAISPSASAVTHTWNGSTSNSMSNPLNWTGGTPTSGDTNLTLDFPASPGANSPNQDVANPLSVESLQFGQQFYLLVGNGYQLNNLGAAPTISIANSANINFNAPLDFNAATTLTIGNSSSLQLSQLTGGNLTINSTATTNSSFITFNNAVANSLSGTTSINGNTFVQVNSPANVAAFSGNLNVTGDPTNGMQIRFLAANQLAAGTNFGALANSQTILFAPQVMNDVEVSSGFINNNGNALSIQGTITNNGGLGVIQQGSVDFNGQFKTVNTTVATGNLEIQSPISNGRINKTGPGRLAITNSGNSFSGQNVVNAGTLAGNPDSIGTNVLNNGTVELLFGTLNSNIISGPGNVIVNSIVFAAPQSYTGGTIVTGTATGDTSTLLGDFSSTSSGQIEFNQNSSGTFSNNLSGNIGLVKQGTAVLSVGGNSTNTGSNTLNVGGLNFLTDSAVGTGALLTQGTNVTLEATGNRTLSNLLIFGSSASFVGSGNLTFTDTSNKMQNFTVTHSSTGTTTIDGKYALTANGSIVVNSGSLVLGDAAAVGGFVGNGPIVLNGGTLTVRSLNFTTLSDVTLAGGTLNAPNGYAIPLGAALQGNGGVTGRVASANGSTVIATGNLNLGDSASPAGVNLDGELYTNNNTVTLQDSNQAVLGSITDLGTATLDGTLVASNGAVLNFGRNIIGRGQIQSNNTLADAVIVNGDVNGDAISTPLVFTGYVKGVGTFNNVAFSGTFSPGLSPTLMTVGNTLLLPSNVLDIEVGGLNRGSQYDAFDVTPSSTMFLDGTLQVTLFNAFNPSLGNQFDLFNGTTSGVFANFALPALNPGLAWDTSLLYTSGILQVVAAVPEPATLSMALVVGVAFLKRRRS